MGKHDKKIDGKKLLDDTEQAVGKLGQPTAPDPRAMDSNSGVERDIQEYYGTPE